MSWRIIGLAAIVAELVFAAMLWIARQHSTPNTWPIPLPTANQLARVRDLVDSRKRLADELEKITQSVGGPSENLMTYCPGPWALREKGNADALAPATQPTTQPSITSSGR
jgi:hypothetical protein